MKNRTTEQLKQTCLALAMAVFATTGFVMGVGVAAAQGENLTEHDALMLKGIKAVKTAGESFNISDGENATETYALEMWMDGTARITTTHEYIRQLSDHTVLVTDRSLDDVQQEILGYTEGWR